MSLCGEHLVLRSVTMEEAPGLLLAFNGDEQFNQWSGYASAMTQADMLGTQRLPGGTVWSIIDRTDTLVGVAEDGPPPSP